MVKQLLSSRILMAVLLQLSLCTSGSAVDSNSSIFVKTEFVADQASSYSHSVVQVIISHYGDDGYVASYTKQSGFYIEDGLIVTTAHGFIEEDGDHSTSVRYKYSLYSGGFTASVILFDVIDDICIIKPTSEDFMESKALSLSDGSLSVGEDYYSIGFPQNVYSLLTINFESTKDITATVYETSIHHDAASCFATDCNASDASLTQGLSGSPIVNADGEVVVVEGYSDNGHVYGISLDELENALAQCY